MNILIVEDEPNVAAFLKKGLQEQAYEVEVAYDGTTGKMLATRNSYSLIMLDVIMPGINGLELCKAIRSFDKQTPILMLTALGTTDDVVTGLDNGADDYIAKPFKFKELLARVRALTRRNSGKEAALTMTLADLELNLDTKTASRCGKEINLTAREFALLEYFLKNKGKVLSRMDLLENVWNFNLDLGQKWWMFM